MVILTIGGAERTLVFDVNAMCRLREEHGINLLHPDEHDILDPVVFRALVWGGLLHAEPMLKLETVGEWIQLHNFGAVSQALIRALQGDLTPSSEAGRAAADPPVAEGVESDGTTSSASATVSVG